MHTVTVLDYGTKYPSGDAFNWRVNIKNGRKSRNTKSRLLVLQYVYGYEHSIDAVQFGLKFFCLKPHAERNSDI